MKSKRNFLSKCHWILNRYEMPEQLLDRLCNRSKLTTSQIRDYLEAYTSNPERLDSNQPMPNQGNKDISESSGLTRYAGIALQRQEVGHDQLH